MHAVLVGLLREGQDWDFLMEVRSERVSQPGEICFPGGRAEPSETPEEAALRETEEELGIPREEIQLLGKLEPERMTSGRLIQPVTGILPAGLDPAKLTLSEEEVAEAFLLPVSWLLQHPAAEYDLGTCRDEDLPEPLLRYLGHYAPFTRRIGKTTYWQYRDHGIWGLTARILGRAIRSEWLLGQLGGAEV